MKGECLPDVEFALSDRDRLRPDVFDPDLIPIPGAPDIAIEVSKRSSDSQAKVLAYLRHGTAEVWQIYPKSQTVEIHWADRSRSTPWDQPVETTLLPGFAFHLSTLLAEDPRT